MEIGLKRGKNAGKDFPGVDNTSFTLRNSDRNRDKIINRVPEGMLSLIACRGRAGKEKDGGRMRPGLWYGGMVIADAVTEMENQ